MEEANTTEMEIIKAKLDNYERIGTPTPTTSAASTPDNKSLVLGLQAANSSMHALDQANRELIEALGEAQLEIERFVMSLKRLIYILCIIHLSLLSVDYHEKD